MVHQVEDTAVPTVKGQVLVGEEEEFFNELLADKVGQDGARRLSIW